MPAIADHGRPGAGLAAGDRWAEGAVHVGAAAVVVIGVVAQLLRPLAPDLGSPPGPGEVFDAEFLSRAAAYRGPVYAAGVMALLIRVLIALVAALTPWGRRLVGRIVDRVGAQRPARAAAVIVATVVVVTDIVLAPLAFWIGYVHDGRYGLRTQGLAGWAYDWLVFHVPVWLGVSVLALAGYALARRLPRLWPAVGGAIAGVLAGVVTFVSPLVLEPLSHTFTPLQPGPVRAEVERVLAAAGERVDAILVADASRRTTRQNAYVSGLGASERVVLYDTLIQNRPPREVGLVLAHEIAHRRNGDLWRMVLLSAGGGIVAAYGIAAVTRMRSRSGRQNGQADPRAAAVVVLTALLLNVVSAPVQSWVSRRAEAAADLGSLQLTDRPEVFIDMQVALATANLAEPRPPRWFTVWRGSHPPPMARIAMARWWDRR